MVFLIININQPMVWDYVSLSRRSAEPKPRASHDLDQRARNRLIAAVQRLNTGVLLHDVSQKYEIEQGGFPVTLDSVIVESDFRTFAEYSSSEEFLEFYEIYINFVFEEQASSREDRLQFLRNINRIIIEEGLLWDLEPKAEKVEELTAPPKPSYAPSEYLPSEYGVFKFEKLASEAVADADQRIQALAEDERWREPLAPYNQAWESFQEEEISSALLANLYNSIEMVLQEICVEQESWNTETESVSDYLDSIKENGLMDPDPSMYGEWTNIVKGLRIGVQKPGRDRTSHKTIDRDYALLLMHQTAAFLTFIIRRYESNFD